MGRKQHRFMLLASVILSGSILGLGVFTFVYAKGFSYLSNDPEACGNCHVMREVVSDWQRGDHHHVAVCNDCHVPHNFMGKWATKALNGIHHSYAFTFTNTPLHIDASKLSKSIVAANCQRCHAPLLPDSLLPASRNAQHGGGASCVSCHKSVGHFH